MHWKGVPLQGSAIPYSYYFLNSIYIILIFNTKDAYLLYSHILFTFMMLIYLILTSY